MLYDYFLFLQKKQLLKTKAFSLSFQLSQILSQNQTFLLLVKEKHWKPKWLREIFWLGKLCKNIEMGAGTMEQ